MKFKVLIIGGMMLTILLSGLAQAVQVGTVLKIKDPKGKELVRVSRESETLWSATLEGQKFSLENQKPDFFTFILPDGTRLEAQLKENEIKLKRAEAPFMKIKLKTEKIKVTLKDVEAQSWELKLKDEKMKVLKAEKGVGQIKYYQDTGKLKAKDSQGREMAEVKDLGRLSACLLPFLMDQSVGIDERIFLILFPLALGR